MAARNIRCLIIKVSEMNQPRHGERPWPVDLPFDTAVDMPADSDPLIQRLIEIVQRREAIRNEASPPLREIDPQSAPRPGVVADPWRRGGAPREE